jgi:hypothetical protein
MGRPHIGIFGSLLLVGVLIATYFAYDIAIPPPAGVECVTIWPLPPQCVPTPASIAQWWIWMLTKVGFMAFTVVSIFIALFFFGGRRR